jgi:hypothetical protein
MPPHDTLSLILRIAVCVMSGVAGIRLFRVGLARRYSVLFSFLCFHVARSLALLLCQLLPHPRTAYGLTWFATEPLMWILYILLTLDLYSLVLQDYKGLQTVGRWILFIALPVAILVSGATVLPSWRSPTEKFPVVFYFALVDRGIMFSLLIFILLTLFFLSWYPISLSRNIVVHHVVYMVYLTAHTMAYLVRNVQGDTMNRATGIATLVTTLLCFSAWLFLLSPAGEMKKVVLRHQFTAEEERRLVDQLTAINSTLLRATRK